MPVIRAAEAEVHPMHNARFTSYARPGTGSGALCVWMVELDAATPGQPHKLLGEEVFLMLDGEAVLAIDGLESRLSAGDAAIAPAGSVIRLDNPGTRTARFVVTAPVGFAAELADGTRMTPPWAS